MADEKPAGGISSRGAFCAGLLLGLCMALVFFLQGKQMDKEIGRLKMEVDTLNKRCVLLQGEILRKSGPKAASAAKTAESTK